MKKKVLITDDDFGLRKLYERELKKEGYDVLLASNAEEAMDKVHNENPDLVVMDIRMPGTDGIQALSCILEENAELPVVINTAYTSYKDNFMTWSADAYLVKSMDTFELKNTVRTLIEKRSVCT